jgi:hypothetical protein
MANLISLCTGKSFDTTKQAVGKNQIIQMSGYHDDRFVVHDIVSTKWGLSYELINLRTITFGQCDLVQPLSEKFGIGYYFNDATPEMMDAFEVAILKSEAEQNRQTEQEAQQQEHDRKEQLKVIGRERFKAILPANAQAVIIAEERQNESEPMTDYYGHSTTRTVILGFSTHKRDLFSEMRKVACNFEGTRYLSEKNEDYENREKYSMGAGYYLGASKYSGWIIEKAQLYGSKEEIIERYALIAGDENNICVSTTSACEKTDTETVTGDFILIQYSEKAVALFGDTKPIKDELKAFGGRFNPRLSHDGEKQAGWIFQKSKEQAIRNLLTVK